MKKVNLQAIKDSVVMKFDVNVNLKDNVTLLNYSKACFESVAQYAKQGDSLLLNMIIGIACLRVYKKDLSKKDLKAYVFDYVESIFSKAQAPIPCQRQFYEYDAAARFVLNNLNLPESVNDAAIITYILNKVQSYKSFSKLRQAVKDSKATSPRTPKTDVEKVESMIESLFDKIESLTQKNKDSMLALINSKLVNRTKKANKKAA